MYYTTQVPMVVSRQFDTEVIIANFETGIYYSLTGTAADIWRRTKIWRDCRRNHYGVRGAWNGGRRSLESCRLYREAAKRKNHYASRGRSAFTAMVPAIQQLILTACS